MLPLYISIIQASPHWEDAGRNLVSWTKWIHQARGECVVLPEMFSTGFTMRAELAESPEGPTFQWMKKLSAETGKVLCGSYIVTEEGRYYNRFIWMEPSGNFYSYNKKHLFSLAGEEKHYQTDGKMLLLEYKGWKIAPFVCYDLRFPVWIRRRADFNYDIALFVASWPEKRSYAWKSLLVARAIENQAYVLACNRVGKDGNETEHSGDSVFLDFRGIPLKEAKPFREEILECILDPESLHFHRRAFPFFEDRDSWRFE